MIKTMDGDKLILIEEILKPYTYHFPLKISYIKENIIGLESTDEIIELDKYQLDTLEDKLLFYFLWCRKFNPDNSIVIYIDNYSNKIDISISGDNYLDYSINFNYEPFLIKISELGLILYNLNVFKPITQFESVSLKMKKKSRDKKRVKRLKDMKSKLKYSILDRLKMSRRMKLLWKKKKNKIKRSMNKFHKSLKGRKFHDYLNELNRTR